MSADIYSENEDEPEIYESSSEEWDVSHEFAKKRPGRPAKRLSKKARVKHNNSSDSDIELSKYKPRNKNSNKKQKTVVTYVNRKILPRTIYSNNFTTGSFLINKKDAQVGDPSIHPCIWRVDGKALLQKYEPFEHEGQICHRTTSVYSGWSPLDKDLYTPITVNVVHHSTQMLIVKLNWDQLKQINMDSE